MRLTRRPHPIFLSPTPPKIYKGATPTEIQNALRGEHHVSALASCSIPLSSNSSFLPHLRGGEPMKRDLVDLLIYYTAQGFSRSGEPPPVTARAPAPSEKRETKGVKGGLPYLAMPIDLSTYLPTYPLALLSCPVPSSLLSYYLCASAACQRPHCMRGWVDGSTRREWTAVEWSWHGRIRGAGE